MAEPSCQNIRGGSKGPSSGSSAQCAALPAGEERVSDSPAAVPACAPLSLRVSVPGSESPVLEQQTSGPLPSLCAFLLCTPIDNGWQLPAPGTEVRPASLFAQPSAPPTPFSTRGGGGGGAHELAPGLHGSPAEQTEDSALAVRAVPGWARSIWRWWSLAGRGARGWVRPVGRSCRDRGQPPTSRAGIWAPFCLRKQEPDTA